MLIGPVSALYSLDRLRLHGNRLNGTLTHLAKCINFKLTPTSPAMTSPAKYRRNCPPSTASTSPATTSAAPSPLNSPIYRVCSLSISTRMKSPTRYLSSLLFCHNLIKKWSMWNAVGEVVAALYGINNFSGMNGSAGRGLSPIAYTPTGIHTIFVEFWT